MDDLTLPTFETIDRFLATTTDGTMHGERTFESRFKVERRIHDDDAPRIILSEYQNGHYSQLEEWADAGAPEHAIIDEAESRIPFYLDTNDDWEITRQSP